MFTTLISVKDLQNLRASSADCVVFDCTFELANPSAGNAKYLEQHIAGALRADLDSHLSTHNEADRANGGRHPLPKPDVFAKWLSSMGVNDTTQVVVYDRNGEKVFETTDLTTGWDGTYKGKQLNTAVFVYYLTGEFLNNDKINKILVVFIIYLMNSCF